MIESNVIEWLDFGDSTQKIDVYSKTNFLPLFRFLRILSKNKLPFIIIDVIFLFIFFIQIWTISLINVTIEKEFFLDILNYLKNIINLYEIITNAQTYKNFLIILLAIILLDYALIIFVFLVNKKLNLSYLAIIINFLNIIIFYYLFCPQIIITLSSLWCENNAHKYLRITCYSNQTHLIYTIISLATLLFFILLSFFYSLYCNEIDTLSKNAKVTISRINCNYEIYSFIGKAFIYIFAFFFYKMDYEEEEDLVIKGLFEGLIFLYSLIMSVYVYKSVYFYNNIINMINHFGWYFTLWFSFCILLKSLLNLTGISNFISIGWIVITFVLSKAYLMNENLLITDANIFEFNDIKSIEMLKNILLIKLAERNRNKSNILIYGIIKKFEEFVNNNPEINYQYQKLLNDKNLNKKFNKEDTLPILSIIYLLYAYYLEKLRDKNEITFHMCYYLINKLDNHAFAIFLCSKLKSESHKDFYYKYLLTIDIKDSLISKLKKNSKTESIKHVEIGSVILYNLYFDLFKIKIYDGLCSQIDYFDLIKNTAVTNKTTENFLKIGENIFKNRDEMKIIWNKLIDLNPFNDEVHKDYILYLDTIAQEETLARDETKKYLLLRNSKSQEKYNIYYTMFLNNTSSVLLVDGYVSNGKILYATQNFSSLFMYSGKEILNLTIEDLVPNCIQAFHKELIIDALKYSNIKNIFKEPKDTFLKNKLNCLFSTKLFVKPVPNLTYGLVYFSYLQKINDSVFHILLDKDLKINGFSEMSQSGSSFTMNNGYNLSHNILGNHIGLVLPDILPLLEYKNEEFNIIKKDFELKGYLYPVDKVKEIKNKLDVILEKIKNNKVNVNDFQGNIEDDPQNILSEFNDLMNEYNYQKIRPFSIFYKIKLRTFIDGKFKYYKIFIYNDIISDTQINPVVREEKDIKETIKDKNKFSSTVKTDTSKKSKETVKRIKLKVKDKKEKENENEKNNINNVENSNISRHSKMTNDINNKEGNLENQEKSNKNNNNVNNKNEKKKEKKIIINNINSNPSYNSKEMATKRRCNKIKTEIMNKEVIFPIKIMYLLCYIFIFIAIIFMILDLFQRENAFEKLYHFLQDHLFFSDIKIYVGILYTICVNIRWMSHSLFISQSLFNDSWEFFFKTLLEENLKLMQNLKTYSYQIGEDFNSVVNKRNEVKIYSYKFEEPDIFNYNLDNLFCYIINNQIKLLDTFSYFVKRECKGEPISQKELGLNEINLKNLIETSYYLYKLDLNSFENEKEKEEQVFYYFQFPFLIAGLIFVCLLILYLYYMFSLNNIEINFLDKLINFNSVEFDNYTKRLEEFKKKLRSDNNEEDDKGDDLEQNELESKKKEEEEVEKNDIIEEKNSNEFEKRKNKKKMRSKQSKILQQKRKKLTLMISFFWRSNFFFIVKIALIFIFALLYYVINILISNSNKNAFCEFDEMNHSLDKVYLDSVEIFVQLKRELDLYERNLKNCLENGENIGKMNISRINEVNIPKFGNLIMQISKNSDFKKETLKEFKDLYTNNVCVELIDKIEDKKHCQSFISTCENFWTGVLTKGMEQAIAQMGITLGTVIDELQALNDDKNRLLINLINGNNGAGTESSFILYEQFNQLYLFRAFNKTSNIFSELREEKLKAIKKIIKLILYFYIFGVFLLFAIFYYLVNKFAYLFSSFLNFIAIFPIKYISEDENFYQEIIKYGDKYYY